MEERGKLLELGSSEEGLRGPEEAQLFQMKLDKKLPLSPGCLTGLPHQPHMTWARGTPM